MPPSEAVCDCGHFFKIHERSAGCTYCLVPDCMCEAFVEHDNLDPEEEGLEENIPGHMEED